MRISIRYERNIILLCSKIMKYLALTRLAWMIMTLFINQLLLILLKVGKHDIIF